MRAVLVVCALAGCRVDFDPQFHTDALDVDAFVPCHVFSGGETFAQCQSAFANPSATPDQVVYDCAQSCGFDRCYSNDASTCSACACIAYTGATELCDASGLCAAPLSGTGCIGGSYYTGPPFNCTSANGLVFEGACMVRYLYSIG